MWIANYKHILNSCKSFLPGCDIWISVCFTTKQLVNINTFLNTWYELSCLWVKLLWVKAHTAWFCTLPVTLRLTKGSERRKSGIIKGFFFCLLVWKHMTTEMTCSVSCAEFSNHSYWCQRKKRRKRNNNKNAHFSHSEHDKKKEMCIEFGSMIHCFLYGCFSSEALSKKMSRWKLLM